jgi:hypothetical protein
VRQIEEGLRGAAYLVLCYSDAGVMALWVSREWMSALARQLAGYDVRVLPAMLTCPFTGGGSDPQAAAGTAGCVIGSQGVPARALLMASSVVRPSLAAESR